MSASAKEKQMPITFLLTVVVISGALALMGFLMWLIKKDQITRNVFIICMPIFIVSLSWMIWSAVLVDNLNADNKTQEVYFVKAYVINNHAIAVIIPKNNPELIINLNTEFKQNVPDGTWIKCTKLHRQAAGLDWTMNDASVWRYSIAEPEEVPEANKG